MSKIGFKSTHLLIYLTQCVTVKIAVTISTVWCIALICAKTPAILSIITFFLFFFWHFYCDKNFKTTKSTILTILKGHLEHPNVISVGFPCPGGSDSRSAYNVGDLGLIPGSERSSGEEMATNSSTFAWKLPWMEEYGRLQSMGSQRVGHD